MDKETSIVFTGDIGFDHYMDGKFTDENLISEKVKKFLMSGKHLCVNVEGALSTGEMNMQSNSVAALMHSMDPKVAFFLEGIGADIWNICNNHICDAGPKGIEDTLKAAKEHKAVTVGAGMNLLEASKPFVLDEAGGIGIFSVGYQRGCKKADSETPGCLSWDNFEIIENTIKEIKKACKWCVIIAHGGEEFTSLPSPYTRERYLKFLEMGADIIVGHHPHVPMNYETVGDKVIFYSLGNFIFDTNYQRAQFNTEKGVLVKLNFTEDNFSFDSFGIEINREREGIDEAALPLIFEDVDAKEYELLEPLSAKAFVEATKKQQIFLLPDKYSLNTTDEEWHENFYNPKRSGRVEGEALDFQIIVPIAKRAEENAWKQSKLENVKKYILEQL